MWAMTLEEIALALADEASNLALYAAMGKAGHPSGWGKFDRQVDDLKEAIAEYERALEAER